MKTNKQILILFLIMLIGAPILSAQSKKEYNPEVIGNSHSFCSKQEGAKSGSRQKYYQFKEL